MPNLKCKQTIVNVNLLKFVIPLLLVVFCMAGIAAADPITFTTTSVPSGQVNSAYNQTINATGGTLVDSYDYDDWDWWYVCSGYLVQLVSGTMPAGMSFVSTNGYDSAWLDQGEGFHSGPYAGLPKLTGTPTQAGNFPFTVKVTDYLGATATMNYVLTVTGSILNITTTSMPDGQVNYSYSKTLTAVNGTAPYTWSVVSSSLPDGLSIISSTGVVTGTPTTGGTTNVTFKVVSSDSQEDTQALSIYIAPALSITTVTVPTATLSAAYNTTINVPGGIQYECWVDDPYEPWYLGSGYRSSIISGSLASGLSLASTNGGPGNWSSQNNTYYSNELYAGLPKLTGTPTQAGTFPFTLQVQDYFGATTTRDYVLVVQAGQLNITTASLPDGEQDYPYSVAINYTGGLPPYDWSVISGSLPAGLSLGSPLITGTGTVSGTYYFTLQVTSGDQQTATKALSIYLAPPLTLLTQSPLPAAIIGQAYNTTLSATGGILVDGYDYDEYDWWYVCSGYLVEQISGTNPAGINFVSTNGAHPHWLTQAEEFHNGPYPGLPQYIGTPTVTGVYNAAVRITDFLGAQSTVNYSLTVNYDFNIDTQTVAHPHKDVPFYFALSASGAPGPYTWSVASGSLPDGLTLDSATGVLTGTSTAIEQCYVTFQVAATDPVLNPIAQKQLLIDARDTWDNTTGGDHQGADWTITDTATVGGEHVNINKLTIDQGVTVTVQAGSPANFQVLIGIDIKGVMILTEDVLLELISEGYIHMWPGSQVIARNLAGEGPSPRVICYDYYTGGNGAPHAGLPGLGANSIEQLRLAYGTKHGMDNYTGSNGDSKVPPAPVDPVGGPGGRAVFTAGKDVTIEGLIDVSGGDGQDGVEVDELVTGGAGGGSGGSVVIRALGADCVYLGAEAKLCACGGNGGEPYYPCPNGGGGGSAGRIKIFGNLYAHPDALVCLHGGHGGLNAGDGADGTISVQPLHTGWIPESLLIPNGTEAKARAGGSEVDLTSGNLDIDIDLTHVVPVNGLPHNFTIYYNSAAYNIIEPLGPKWTHSFNQYITPIFNGQILFFTDGTGRTIAFDDVDGDNLYDSYPFYGAYATIARTVVDNVVTGYQLLTKSQYLYTFDANGQIISIEDRNGNIVTVTYNTNDITVTLSGGRTIVLGLTNGLITSVTDPDSNVTAIAYDQSGRLETVSQGTGNEWQYQFTYYGSTDFIATKTEPYSDANLINTVTYAYDSYSRLESVSKVIKGENPPTPPEITRSIWYNPNGAEAIITDFDGTQTPLVFDPVLGTWTSYTAPVATGRVVTTLNEFNPANGNLLSRTPPNGITSKSTYYYDARGNVLTITDALNKITTFEYPPSGPNRDLPTYITRASNDPSCAVTTFMQYDSFGNLLSRTEAFGTSEAQTTDYQYYSSSEPNGIKGKLKQETRHPTANSADDLVTDYYYDQAGYGYLWNKIVREPDATLGDITYETNYTILGQVETVSCPRSQQTHFAYTYDYRGNRKTVRTYTSPGVSYLTTLNYDLMDRLIQRIEDSESGGLAITTDYLYNNLGWLEKTTLNMVTEANIVTSNEYYKNGRLKKTTDPEGATTEYFYYNNGWLQSVFRQVKDSEYAETQYGYDDNGNMNFVRDPMLHVTNLYYTVTDKLWKTETEAESGWLTTIYTIDALGRVTDVQDPKGSPNPTHTGYDKLGRVRFVCTPENISTAYVYDKAGRTTQVVGPWYDSGRDGLNYSSESANPPNYPPKTPAIANYTYYNPGWVKETWVTGFVSTKYQYDKAGNVKRVEDPEGKVTAYTYDRCAHLQSTTVDPAGPDEQKTFYVYDKIGRQKEVHAAYQVTGLETVTYSFYDNAGRITRQYTGSETYATRYFYNKRGQVTRVYDAEGWAASPVQYFTENKYDKGGRLVETINALGKSVKYEYDKDGLRTKVSYKQSDSGDWIDTTYTYYKNHLLWTTVYPGYDPSDPVDGNIPNTTTNVYDANGNLWIKTDSKGTITYYYDDNNRLTGKSYTDYSASYAYDAASNLLTTVDNNTNTENTYDGLNRLTAVTDKTYTPNKTIAYTYWQNGLRKTMDGPESGTSDKVEYFYDGANQLDTVELDGVEVADYDYNKLGQRIKLTLGNGAYAEYEYNHLLRWLTKLTNMKSDQTTFISSFAYQHDKVGNRTKMTLDTGDYIVYDYDDIYQLKYEKRYDSSANPIYSITWDEYDNVGNRKQQTKNSVVTTYNYNKANQLVNETTNSVTTNYTYDANGNQDSKTIGNDTWSWAYDRENRQISHTVPGNTIYGYGYDAMGRRISKSTDSAITEKYVLDGANVIADYDGSNNLTASYVTPFLDQNLLTVRGENTYYYTQDGLGSVREFIDSSTQQPVNTYDYYAFGESLNWSGSIANRYTYTSREWDSESANYYYRARYYTPTTGRFTERDPYEYVDGIDIYTYVNSNPINKSDPLGLQQKGKSATSTEENDDSKHVMLQSQKYYCCCVTDLSFNVGPLPSNYSSFLVGNTLTINATIEYKECNQDAAGDCRLSWLEKSSLPPIGKLSAGILKDEWWEMTQVTAFKNSPTTRDWRNKIPPGPTSPLTIPLIDHPSGDIRQGSKTLSLIISVFSGGYDCDCQFTMKSLYLKQEIKIENGKLVSPPTITRY